MISVCIASYNGEKYIKEQIDSILCQLSPEDEIIISDDSSTDGTVDIVKSYCDHRIRLLENCKFRSPIFNLENALKDAKGDFIFLADQDDIWDTNKVKITLNYLRNYSMVVSDCILINEKGEIICESFFELNKSKPGLLHNFIKNSYIGCCMAFDSKILKAVLPFPKTIAMHDQWIGLIGEIYFQTKYIQEPLILYRRHGGNASYSGERSKNSVIRKVLFRVSMLRDIISRVVKISLSDERE